MFFTWFGVLIAVWILIAFAVGIFARKMGFALVMVAFAVLWIWDKNVNGWEWLLFLLVALPIGLYTLMVRFRERRFRPHTRAGAGAIVLILAIILATPANIFDVVKAPFASELAQMKADIVEEVDYAKEVAAIEKRVAALEKRADANEAHDTKQDQRLDALETSVKSQQEAIDELKTKVTGTVTTAPPIDLSSDQIADAIASDMVDQGFKPGDITVGTINWDENTYDVGDHPFVDRSIDSVKKLRKQLNASTPQAKATLIHLFKAVPASEQARLKDGRGFVPVQFNKRVCLEGNTYFFGGTAERDGIRCHEAGDVIWAYVGSDGKVYWDASVRADCGNGGMSAPPRPTREKPDQPKDRETPGTSSTPGTPTTPSTSTSTPTPTKSTSTPSSTPTPTKSTSTPSSTPTPTKSTSTPSSTPTPTKSTSTPSSTPTPTKSTSTPSSTPTPTKSTSTPSCPPGGNGTYGCPKATASPPPSQSPRPSGTTTAQPSARPTHSGPVLTSGPTATRTPPPDNHTPTSSSAPTVLPTPTASGTIGDG